MAYRTAEQTRWEQFDFVVGYEVKTTQNGHHKEDICDQLAGKYPKSFVFTGWHPQCMCYCIPILKTEDEFWADDSEDSTESVNEVKLPPENFVDWVRDNAERIENAENGKGTLPYFIKDNKGYVNAVLKMSNGDIDSHNSYNSVFTSEKAPLTPTKILDISEVQSKMAKLVEKNKIWFSRGYNGIEARSTSGGGYMSTTLDGKISVNFATDTHGFNAGESLVSAMSKIEKGEKLSKYEEYSLEVLWHEILHNKSANTVELPPIDSPLGFTRVIAETINQLVARHSYPSFITKLGGEATNQEWVLNNGYGYSATVKNMRSLLTNAGIDESQFVSKAEKILMKDYSGIDVKISKLLADEFRKVKGKGDIVKLYQSIELKEFSQLLEIFNKS